MIYPEMHLLHKHSIKYITVLQLISTGSKCVHASSVLHGTDTVTAAHVLRNIGGRWMGRAEGGSSEQMTRRKVCVCVEGEDCQLKVWPQI